MHYIVLRENTHPDTYTFYKVHQDTQKSSHHEKPEKTRKRKKQTPAFPTLTVAERFPFYRIRIRTQSKIEYRDPINILFWSQCGTR